MTEMEKELLCQFKILSDAEKDLFLHQLGQFNYKKERTSGGRYREVRKMCGLDPWDYDREGV